MGFSIIQYYGENKDRCGYCKGTDCAVTSGMHAYNLQPQDYQDLIDRGWRRSGKYCYKMNNAITCCPCYTIKCDALNFNLSKSHKKILKRMRKFLRDGRKDDDMEKDDIENISRMDSGILGEPKEPIVPKMNLDMDAIAVLSKLYKMETDKNDGKEINAEVIPNDEMGNSNKWKICEQDKASTNGEVLRKKAKQIRLERHRAKLEAKGITFDESNKTKCTNVEKSLQDYFNDVQPDDKHTLKIKLLFTSKLTVEDEVFQLFRKYQLKIHNDKPERLTLAKLERFLYKSPLEFTKTANGPSTGYGSFHQQYWLDDKLIAVGVVDILPYCVSSVYFFYDPDYSFLSLGTYGSLREIAYVQQLAKVVPELKYYYMGFYIHSCPKMRYKGKLVPSYLACSETYSWHLITDEIRQKLDENKYQRFSKDMNEQDANEFTENDLDDVILLSCNREYITYKDYKKISGELDDRGLILEYGKLVGKNVAHRMLYVIT